MNTKISKLFFLAAIIISFTCALVLAGCSKLNSGVSDGKTSETAQQAAEAQSDSEQEKKAQDGTDEAELGLKSGAESSATGKVSIEPADEIVLLHPILRQAVYGDSVQEDDGNKYLSFYYRASGMKLDDEEAFKYPALSKALDKLYEEQEAQYTDMCGDMRTVAKDMLADYKPEESGYISLENYNGASTLRADNVLFSINIHNEIFYGWNNDRYYDYGLTFDTRTGRLLSLSDIAADEEAIRQGIKAELGTKYTGYKIDEDRLDSEIEALLKGKETKESSWSIDYNGINIIFNEYCITDSSEQLSVKLSFAKYPDAVIEVCKMAPDSYMTKIISPASSGMYADIYNNGELVGLSISGIQSYDYDYGEVVIELKGADGESKSETFEAHSFHIEPYYVKHGDRHFLYIFETYENDYTVNKVYELTDGRIAEVGAENQYEPSIYYDSDYGAKKLESKDKDMSCYYSEFLPPSDTTAMKLASKCDLLSTYNIERTYTVGENGMPESHELYKADAYMQPVTLKAIDALETDAAGKETGAKIVIPKGEKLSFYMTDNESFVIFILGDGRYAKVNVDTSDYPYRIGGEDIYEVLDGMAYAG